MTPPKSFFWDSFENHEDFQGSSNITIIALPKIFFLLEIPENNNNKKREKEKIFETIKMKFFNSQNLFFCSKSQKSIIIKKFFQKNLLKTTFFCSKSALANNNKWHEKDYCESRCILLDFFSVALEINNGNPKKKDIFHRPVGFWIFSEAREIN